MLRELSGRGARLSVVTLGHRGALALAGDQMFESPAFAVRTIDTTGAGDAFRSGFIWALVNQRGPVEALRVANATAAMNCRELGAQGGLPTFGELEKFLEE
jgi:sugar/nucleoside kinase (ribokinase family)